MCQLEHHEIDLPICALIRRICAPVLLLVHGVQQLEHNNSGSELMRWKHTYYKLDGQRVM